MWSHVPCVGVVMTRLGAERSNYDIKSVSDSGGWWSALAGPLSTILSGAIIGQLIDCSTHTTAAPGTTYRLQFVTFVQTLNQNYRIESPDPLPAQQIRCQRQLNFILIFIGKHSIVVLSQIIRNNTDGMLTWFMQPLGFSWPKIKRSIIFHGTSPSLYNMTSKSISRPEK